MILVDANLLVYAHVGSFPQHGAAREWLHAMDAKRRPISPQAAARLTP